MPRKSVPARPVVATFFHAKYPHMRLLWREEQDAPPTFDVQFNNGILKVYSEEEAAFVREQAIPGSFIYEGNPDDAVECELCKKRQREPIVLNGKAMQAHIRIAHE